MELDPGVVASALVTIATALGVFASYLNKRARMSRRELRRTREALELGAGYIHDLRMQLQNAGITPHRPPARWLHLTRRDDEDD